MTTSSILQPRSQSDVRAAVTPEGRMREEEEEEEEEEDEEEEN